MCKIDTDENTELKLADEWFAEARDQTLETLPDFMNRLLKDYGHGYGTIVHAVAACAIAAAWAANESCSGITGFQAGCVMWDFIRQWNYRSNKCGLKIVDYDNMLYPQYEEKFDNVISKDVWEALREEAKKKLEAYTGTVHPAVFAHWESIVEGKVPFGYTVKED